MAIARLERRPMVRRTRTRSPEKPDQWLWNVDGVPALPYRLPELLKAVAGGCTILIPEGEAKVDLLRSWNVPATCCAGGAKKWRAEHAAFLRGASVVVLPDNDNVGRAHMHIIAASLQGIAASIRVLELPGSPAKGDIVDWVSAGSTQKALEELVAQAPDWQPPAATAQGTENEKAEARQQELLDTLARLPRGIEFARQRRKPARELGVPVAAIDAELEARCGEKAAVPLHAHWIVERWPEPVDGDALLRDLISRIRWHVVGAPENALAIALWIVLAWVHDEVATHSPILNINSAEPESGKSTTLGLISFLARRCVFG
jgi:hypothetical protein